MKYAVMDKDLDGIYIEGDYDTCSRWCDKVKGVIVERPEVKCGFGVHFRWERFNFGWKYDKDVPKLSLGRLQIIFTNEYRTDIGKIVYTSKGEE